MSYYRPKATTTDTTASQAAYYNQYYAPQYSALPTVGAPSISANPYTYSYPTVATPTVQSAYYPSAAATAVPARPLIVRPTVVAPPVIVADSTITPRPAATAYAAATTTKTSTDSTSTSVRPASKVGPLDPNKKRPKKKTVLRSAGGQTWEDDSLLTWDPNDFRIFCGDLGNEVTDDLLAKAFQKYKSFLKAHVVRDKRSQKTKGYGFVSFKDPNDFVKAMKEMNGKYIGNRPVKLRKSTWKDRNIDARKKKPY
eukprot:jgi/Orpsp1_1/1178778/evm.model.c7180000066707.2